MRRRGMRRRRGRRRRRKRRTQHPNTIFLHYYFTHVSTINWTILV
jgi:hypothetical protein